MSDPDPLDAPPPAPRSPWPPTLPPQRNNASAMANNHPDDHNMVANALAQLAARATLDVQEFESHVLRGGFRVAPAITWEFPDHATYPVRTIATISANVSTTGWRAGFAPAAEIFTNSLGSPWMVGAGLSYARVIGPPFDAWMVGPEAAGPATLPSIAAVQVLEANQGIVWSLRCVFHDGAGPVSWMGGYHVVLRRDALQPHQVSALPDHDHEEAAP